MDIALVTREIGGLTRNGGIGTAMRHLCDYLHDWGGHQLTIYFTGRPVAQIFRFAAEMRKRGIRFRPIISPLGLLLRRNELRCGHVSRVLRRTGHDVYIFHEFMADGYFCFKAREEENAFAGKELLVVTHGSSLWVDEGNGRVSTDPARLRLYDMERSCCEKADALISPSRYLMEWMQAHGWRLPFRSLCLPNFSQAPDAVTCTARHAGEAIRELVFFGRLEERKGVRVFCESLRLLCAAGNVLPQSVTFLGKEDSYSATAIRDMLSPLSAREVRITFHTGWDSAEALRYLRQPGRLAVMPSLQENSPCTVSECLDHGIPFLASSIGGGVELVPAEERDRYFCAPDPHVLAKRLENCLLAEHVEPARPLRTREELMAAWQEVLDVRTGSDGTSPGLAG